jgi:hypothetical protein
MNIRKKEVINYDKVRNQHNELLDRFIYYIACTSSYSVTSVRLKEPGCRKDREKNCSNCMKLSWEKGWK